MKEKITIKPNSSQTFRGLFERFVVSRTARGVSDITIKNYKDRLHGVSKYIDIEMPLNQMTEDTFDYMVVGMRSAGLKNNTVATYVRTVRAFLNWCKRNG